ncbi:MAG: Hpt domain-containing protein [Nitrospira sp.]|nr:Hpt domain-containing protein [Nitrospira sp.]
MNRNTVFDLREALSRVDDDRETLQAMIEVFLEQGPQDLAAVRQALERRDATAAARSAHRLKGSVLQFCAEAAVEAAKAVEAAAKGGDVEETTRLFQQLEAEMVRLCEALRTELEKNLAA